MKTALATLAAVAALATIAAPAAAQSYGQDRDWRQDQNWNRGGYNLNDRQARLNQRIEIGVRHGDLTRREAWSLRSQSQEIARLEARYRINGLSRWERADLDRRFDRLEAQIRAERHDNDDRWDSHRNHRGR